MRVAIVGSRNCGDFQLETIYEYLPDTCTTIISGGAEGIDRYAEKAAEEKRLRFECIRPDYHAHGRQAPLVRNGEIVKRADLVLAFWDFHSRGTAHTIVQCIEQGVQVRVIGLEG